MHMNFSQKHPLMYGLFRRTLTIVVTWNVILLCLIGTLITFGVFGAVAALGAGSEGSASGYQPVYGSGSRQFLSVPVNGVIAGTNHSDDSLSFFSSTGMAYGYDIKDELYRAADDSTIDGVILEIDSPGGTIYGARAIADGVKYFKAKTDNKKPVYAHIEGTGASGAYWAAVSADKVFSDYGSDVGSIGVILGPIQFYDKVVATDGGLLGGGVVTQNGIESSYITAGTSKDVGNPYRRLTADEVNKLQSQVNNEYDGFVKYVSERRNIPADTIKGQIGAMAYDPKTAKDLKLIDEIGSRQDAYDALAGAAGVQGNDYSVVKEYSQAGFVQSLLGAVTRKSEPKAVEFDKCALTRQSLAYHGDVGSWCSAKGQ